MTTAVGIGAGVGCFAALRKSKSELCCLSAVDIPEWSFSLSVILYRCYQCSDCRARSEDEVACML